MTKPIVTVEFYIPYENTELLDPTPENKVFTTADVQTVVPAPSIEKLVLDGKNEFVDNLNRTILPLLQNCAKRFSDPCQFELLKPEQVSFLASSREVEEYVGKLIELPGELEKFDQWVRGKKHLDPWARDVMRRLKEIVLISLRKREALLQQDYGVVFVAKVLESLVERDWEGAKRGGRIFHQIQDPKKQKEILLKMRNIGTSARMLMWAETNAKDPFFYNERCTAWAKEDKKLASIVGTKGGTGLDVHTRFSRLDEAAQAQDEVLKLFVDYYKNRDFSSLKEGLERLKKDGRVVDYFLSEPHQGIIEMVGVYFIEPPPEMFSGGGIKCGPFGNAWGCMQIFEAPDKSRGDAPLIKWYGPRISF